MQRQERHKTANRALVTLVLCAFVYFCCGNTLFIHSHTYANNTIVHSHPYLPSSHHSHSSHDYGAIAWCNAAMLAVKAETALQLQAPMMRVSIIDVCLAATPRCACAALSSWRAPPCV
ncbi:MAG: hypothetical protein ACI30K_02015 [Muribaculaceae bacterium]